MASCYDCLHCEVCSDIGDSGYSYLKEDASKCKNFKNKADFKTKVFCGSSDCIYNKCGLCRAEGIYLDDKHLHTVHEGFKHLNLCKTYEECEESKNVREMIN